MGRSLLPLGLLPAFALLLIFLATSSEGNEVMHQDNGTVLRTTAFDCGGQCVRRCSAARYSKRCLRYCNICCGVCSCVPPGTFGNKEKCPCYNNLRNSKGLSKCP